MEEELLSANTSRIDDRLFGFCFVFTLFFSSVPPRRHNVKRNTVHATDAFEIRLKRLDKYVGRAAVM